MYEVHTIELYGLYNGNKAKGQLKLINHFYPLLKYV